MHDKTLVVEILSQIITALETIEQRFDIVKNVDDFTDTPSGMEKLDSICMLLIAIGESLKKIDKITDKQLLVKYSAVDWKGAKGLRDIISHHYFDVDAKYIFSVCKDRLPNVLHTIKQIRDDLS